MKRYILILILSLGLAAVANAQNIRVGARIGSGFQAQGEYAYNESCYVEGRFGMAWYTLGDLVAYGGYTADFTVLHNWNIFKMDWTPSVGQWFFDAGAGLTIGGRENFANIGVAGCAKLGLEFNNVPLRLALDWTPAFGPEIIYGDGWSSAAFNEYGLANLGISLVYCF